MVMSFIEIRAFQKLSPISAAVNSSYQESLRNSTKDKKLSLIVYIEGNPFSKMEHLRTPRSTKTLSEVEDTFESE